MLHDINFTSNTQKVTKHAVWLTDLHVDAVDSLLGNPLETLLKEAHPDILLIGGDICNGVGSLTQLEYFSKMMGKPVYFVLGNHDYYYGSIKRTRFLAEQLAKSNPLLHYLTVSEPIELNSTTALIGHDGWSDGGEGDFLNSNIYLNDYKLIEELSQISNQERFNRLQQLGKEAAAFIQAKVEVALEKYEQLLILTHTPPFKECCLYDNHVTDENWAPHFVCKAMGDVLLDVAKRHPEKQILVLCGHSHHKADVHKLDNLRILTGHSNLGFPTIQGIIDL